MKYTSLFLTIVLASSCLADWKSDANARIEQYRKRSVRISVLDHNGNPVPAVNVAISQKKHRFAFGTSIRYTPLISNATYSNFIQSHFEWAVCDNDTKWGLNESVRDVETYDRADYIYNWCVANDIKMRGHCLFWEQVNGEFPTWLDALTWEQYPTPSEGLDEVDERIVSAVNHFKGKFYNWDVDNEWITDEFFRSRLGNAGIAHMYNYAKQIDPNCGMFMNEFIGNSFDYLSSWWYVYAASDLINNYGANVDGFGIQGHLEEDVEFPPQIYYDDVLQPLSIFEKPIWVTEFDASHSNPTASADNIENFMRICFSHYYVEGIIFWGFMDGQMWRPNAGLIDAGGTLTPGGVRYESLLNEWTTNDANYTAPDGNANLRGFHGTYEVTLTKPNQGAEIYTIELEPGDTIQQFTFDTNFVATPPEYNAPTPNPMTWASAPQATGGSTITMTASVATDIESPPVKYYFQCTTDANKDSGWQASPTYAANGLSALTQYSFRVKACDSYMYPNETGWSEILSATTLGPEPAILGDWVTDLNHPAENGSNRVLIFIAHEESIGSNKPTLSSVTYGGQPMTKIIDANVTVYNSAAYVAAFILKEPNIAAANGFTFVPTWNGTINKAGYSSAFFENVDQVNSLGQSAKKSGTNVNQIATDPLPTNNADMAVLAATSSNGGYYAVNNGFIEGAEQTIGGTSGLTGVAGRKSATGAAETPSVTFTGTLGHQVIIGFVLRAIQTCATIQTAGQGLEADLNHDCYIDYADLKIVADNWLNECTGPENCGGADFVPVDGIVDFFDFADFANQWMQCNDPQDSSCN